MSFDELLEELAALELLLRSMRQRRDKLKKGILEIYSFKTIASPVDKNWEKRAIEEEKAFRAFKHSKYGDLLPHFLSLRRSTFNPQYFYTIYKDKTAELAIIKLPRLYPELPPNSIISISKKLEIYTSHTQPDKCLGYIVKNKWDESGKMGIAHWLLFVEIYLNLIKNPVKINK